MKPNKQKPLTIDDITLIDLFSLLAKNDIEKYISPIFFILIIKIALY